jgi:hypothetical protein
MDAIRLLGLTALLLFTACEQKRNVSKVVPLTNVSSPQQDEESIKRFGEAKAKQSSDVGVRIDN